MQITIKNKQYPVSFGTAAIRLFCKESKIPFQAFTKKFEKIEANNIDFDKFDDIALLVLCGVKDGLRKENRRNDFDLEIEDFYDFIDAGGDLEAVFAELTESMPEAKEETQQTGNAKPAKEIAKA